jgi:hypothetical protein
MGRDIIAGAYFRGIKPVVTLVGAYETVILVFGAWVPGAIRLDLHQ